MSAIFRSMLEMKLRCFVYIEGVLFNSHAVSCIILFNSNDLPVGCLFAVLCQHSKLFITLSLWCPAGAPPGCPLSSSGATKESFRLVEPAVPLYPPCNPSLVCCGCMMSSNGPTSCICPLVNHCLFCSPLILITVGYEC